MANTDTPFEIDLPPDEPVEEAKPEAKEPSVTDLQIKLAEKEAETQKRINEEIRQRDEFWAKREQAAPPAEPKAPKVETEPDPLDELDILTLLTDEKDPEKINKTFRKAVRESARRIVEKGGFVTQEQMNQQLQALIQGATATAQLVKEFPWLSSEENARLVGDEVSRLSQDPAYKNLPEHAIQRIATLEVERRVGAKLTAKETEADRLARIERQRGGGGDNYGGESPDGGLTQMEKTMARKLGLSDKEYLESKREMARGA